MSALRSRRIAIACTHGSGVSGRPYLWALLTVLLWSCLGLLTAGLRHIPPFLQVGITLTVAGLLWLPRWREWRVPFACFLTGVLGIFGNLLFYYSAFQYAPPVAVNTVNYLWPLFIILLSPLFVPHCRLGKRHLLGGAAGLIGTRLAIGAGGGNLISSGYAVGYLLAGLGALVWALYSLSLRRFGPQPAGAVGGFCLAAGLLGLGIFAGQGGAAFDFSLIRPVDWLYLILLGAGPCGLAYFTWERAMQGGNPPAVGALAYLTPALSTAALALLGGYSLSPAGAAGVALIAGGCLLGAGTERKSRPPRLTDVEGPEIS